MKAAEKDGEHQGQSRWNWPDSPRKKALLKNFWCLASTPARLGTPPRENDSFHMCLPIIPPPYSQYFLAKRWGENLEPDCLYICASYIWPPAGRRPPGPRSASRFVLFFSKSGSPRWRPAIPGGPEVQ